MREVVHGDRAVGVQELDERSQRQVPFATEPDAARGLTVALPFGTRGRSVFVAPADAERIARWVE